MILKKAMVGVIASPDSHRDVAIPYFNTLTSGIASSSCELLLAMTQVFIIKIKKYK